MKILLPLLFITSFSFGQIPTYIPTDGLVGWYGFNGNANDETGNGNNPISNNATLVYDRFLNANSAYEFDGVDQFINYGDVESFEGNNQMSFSFWMMTFNLGSNTSFSLNRPIFSKWYSSSVITECSYLTTTDGENLIFSVSNGTSFTSVTMPIVDLLNSAPSDWVNIVITFNQGNVKIYFNGVQQIDNTITEASIYNSNEDFKIGDWYHDVNASYQTFMGVIDDFGLWNRELNQCEIDQIYSGNECNVGINEINLGDKKELVKIVNQLGQEVEPEPNKVLVYIYSDGSTEKVFISK